MRLSRDFRSTVFAVHRWIGTYLLLFFGLIFATGTLSVFPDEVELLSRPGLFRAGWERPGPADPAALYARVEAAMPEANILVVTPATRPWLPDKVRIRDGRGRKQTVWLDPATGEILGRTGAVAGAIPEAILKVHQQLLVGTKPTRLLMPAMSVVLLTSLVTGLIYYRRFWRGFFRLPGAGVEGRMRAGMWHRLIGLWLLPFLLVMALSAMVFLADQLGAHGRFPRPGPLAEREARLPAGFGAADLGRAIAELRQMRPSFVVESAVMPGARAQPIILNGYDAGKGSILGRFSAQIDPVGPRVNAINEAGRGNLMATLTPIANQLHFGAWGGTFSAVLWGLFGLLALFLLVKGGSVHVAQSREGRERGGLRLYLRLIGLWRWAYLGLALGLAALFARYVL